jgi:hypothetical protein
MLMLGNKRVQGTFFSDYFASCHDRSYFVAAIGRDISESEPSGIMPLHLKDSQCREVQVHAYYTSFYAKDSSQYYIVGIVEAEERTVLDSVGPLSLRDRAERGMENTLGHGGSLSGSGNSSVISLHSIGHDVGEISVVLSCHSDYRVLSCSPGFTALCGASFGGEEAKFKDWLVHPHNFTEFIDEGVHDFIAQSLFTEQIILRLPGSTCDYVAGLTARDCITYHASNGPEAEQFTVRLRLEQLCKRRKPREKTKGRGTPTSMSVIGKALAPHMEASV